MEVVGGRETSPETIAWCLDFYRHIGKRPIDIRKEAPGHLANRLQAALWREAVNAVVCWARLGRGRRHCDQCRAGPALGGHGAAHDLPSGRR